MRIGDWEFRVSEVYWNANKRIARANSFNEDPPAGSQHVMIAIIAKWLGPDSGRLETHRFKVVGDSAVVYDDHCGVMPDPSLWGGSPEVFTGGELSGNADCWAVKGQDLDSLVMFYDPRAFSDLPRTWFALR